MSAPVEDAAAKFSAAWAIVLGPTSIGGAATFTVTAANTHHHHDHATPDSEEPPLNPGGHHWRVVSPERQG